jgi:hypothetical protein
MARNTDQGFIHSVTSTPHGSRLVTAEAAGSTVLNVNDAGDFAEDGGTLVVSTPDTGDLTKVNETEYDYSTVDYDADTVTLTSGLVVAAEEGDWVKVVPQGLSKVATVVIADRDEAVLAAVPVSLTRVVPDGVRTEGEHEPVVIALRDYEWTITDLPGRAAALRSVDYSAGTTGWGLDDDGAQFENANVTGSLGVTDVTTESLRLGDRDLETDVLGPLAGGVVAFANVATGTGTASIAATETAMFEFNAGDLLDGHVYYIVVHGHMPASTAGDAFDFRLRWTGDNTAPALTSGIIDGSLTRVNVPTVTSTHFAIHGIFYLPAAPSYPSPLRLLLTQQRVAGTGTGSIYMVSADRSLQFWVFDMGLREELPGSVIQRSGGAGTGTPTATYTKSWNSTDTMSYDFDGQIRADMTYDLFQGYGGSSEHGNTRSMAMFDDAAIRAALAGATITKVTCTFRVKYAPYGPLDVRINQHNSAGPISPDLYTGGPVIANRDNGAVGSTYTVTLPVSFGNALKAGTARGFGFSAPTTERRYHGAMYGSVATVKPKLTITYTK